MTDITQLLGKIESGDPKAAEELLPLIYAELRQLAAAKMAQEQPGHTLQATALVHEAYIRLVGVGEVQQWNSCGHFFAAAAEAMRRILVESARRKMSQKRGGDKQRLELDIDLAELHPPEKMLALHEALENLQRHDPTKCELVKLRYFAGLTNQQAAEALGISTTTADRYWTYARAWLQTEMASADEPD